MSNDFSINMRIGIIKDLYDLAEEVGTLDLMIDLDKNFKLFDLEYLDDIGFIDIKNYTLGKEVIEIKLRAPLIEYVELVYDSVE